MDRYRSEMSTASDVSGALSSAEVTATTLRDSLLAELGPHNPHPDWGTILKQYSIYLRQAQRLQPRQPTTTGGETLPMKSSSDLKDTFYLLDVVPGKPLPPEVHLPALLSTMILPEDRVSQPVPTVGETYGITPEQIQRHNASIAEVMAAVFGDTSAAGFSRR